MCALKPFCGRALRDHYWMKSFAEKFSNQSAKMQISAGIKPVGSSIFVTELTPRNWQI
jgi:hypothetical protein